MAALERIGQAEVRGGSPASVGRLRDVEQLVADRLVDIVRERGDLLPPEWRQGPAFELHIVSGLAALLADPGTVALLRWMVILGEATHVVVFLHEPAEHVSMLLANTSGKLAAALIEGRALRCAGARS